MGRRAAGDEFFVDAALGNELIARHLVEEVANESEPAKEPDAKPVKGKAGPKE
jgi:hypothetical protein